MATTSTWLSPRLSIASRSNCTTSSFSTPLVLKDLVHVTSRPHDRLFWCIGNEKVKPATHGTIYNYCVLKMICFKLLSKIWLLLCYAPFILSSLSLTAKDQHAQFGCCFHTVRFAVVFSCAMIVQFGKFHALLRSTKIISPSISCGKAETGKCERSLWKTICSVNYHTKTTNVKFSSHFYWRIQLIQVYYYLVAHLLSLYELL